jgi:hypothetical protein
LGHGSSGRSHFLLFLGRELLLETLREVPLNLSVPLKPLLVFLVAARVLGSLATISTPIWWQGLGKEAGRY